MIIHFLFGIFLFLLLAFRSLIRFSVNGPRRTSYLSRRFIQAAQSLISRRGGRLIERPWKRYLYVANDSRFQVELNSDSRSILTIRIPGNFGTSVSFQRLPRLVYAFLEAFFLPQSRIPGTAYFAFTSSPEFVSELKGKPGFVELAQELSRDRFSIRLSENGLRLSKSVRHYEMTEENLERWIRLSEDLAAICGAHSIVIPVQPVSSEQKCAYCKERIAEDAQVSSCAQCATPHHEECFFLNGGCSVFGCASMRDSAERVIQ